MSENIQVAKRTGTIGFYTVISRISGLIRDAVVAFFFGTTMAADAFYVAFTIPNLLRRLVAEGALTISFVPIFTGELKRSKKGAKELSDQAFTYLTCVLVVLCVFGIYASPWILRVMASGFQSDPEKFALTVYLTKLVFPYLFFVSLAALMMGVLNSLKKFWSSAAAPIFLNVGLIAGAWWSQYFDPPVLGLAAGVLVGGLLQFAVQLPELARIGFFPRINFNIHPELKSLLWLMLPNAFGAAVYQINVIFLRFFASYLPEGSVSYLWYANRLFEFPMGVFAIALATAILPTLSEFAAEKKWDQFKHSLNFGIRMNFFITIPAMVGLIVLGLPIVRVLLQRGAFDLVAAEKTASCLIAFALGLPFLGLVRQLVPAFYAIKDAKAPVRYASVAVFFNLLFAMWWVKPLAHYGLALALSASSIINALCLFFALRKKIGPLDGASLSRNIAQSSLASLVMGLALWFPRHAGWWLNDSDSLWRQGGELSLALVFGVGIYFITMHLVGSRETQEALQLLKKKFLSKTC